MGPTTPGPQSLNPTPGTDPNVPLPSEFGTHKTVKARFWP